MAIGRFALPSRRWPEDMNMEAMSLVRVEHFMPPPRVIDFIWMGFIPEIGEEIVINRKIDDKFVQLDFIIVSIERNDTAMLKMEVIGLATVNGSDKIAHLLAK